MRRRDFLRLTVALAAATQFDSLYAAKLNPIGVQLSSIPDELVRDLPGAFASLAAIGFREVEAWLPRGQTFDAVAMRKALDANRLTAPSRHWSSWDLRPDMLDRVLKDAEILGNRYVINSALPADQRAKLDSYKRAADWFNDIGRSARERGVQFGFHTERWDFQSLDGVTPFDYLLEHTDSNLVKFQLDTGHMVRERRDPRGYLAKYPGRFVSLHLKDADSAQQLVAAGKGIVDFRAVLKASKGAGISHFFIENERPGLGFDHVRNDFRYFQALEF